MGQQKLKYKLIGLSNMYSPYGCFLHREMLHCQTYIYRCFCAHSKYLFIGIMKTTHNIGSNWHIFQSQDRICLITFYYKKSCDASNDISKSSNVG